MNWKPTGPKGPWPGVSPLLLPLLALPLPAQKRPSPGKSGLPLLIQVKKAHLGTGKVLSPASILVGRGKILAVGKHLVPPKGARRVDLGNLEAAPGLVDPWALTFLAPSDRRRSHGPAEPTARGLVRLRPSQARDLLLSGVTALCVTPPAGGGLGPSSAGVAPTPSGPPRLLQPLAALAIRFSQAGPSDPLAPLKVYQSLKKAFEKAKKYKEKRDRARREERAYRKKWKAYLAALRKAHSKKKPASRKAPGRTSSRPSSKRARRASSRPAPSRGKGKASRGGSPPARPKRPVPFKIDPVQEVLAAALDKKIPVRFEAHTALEVKKALQLAWEFELRPVLVEPWEVDGSDLERASRMGVTVLYGPLDRPDPGFGQPGFRPALLQLWIRAGCPLALGTRGVLSPRFLRDQASLARSMGLTPTQALQAVTLWAARASGMEKWVGSLEKGKRADILFFAGDPADPTLAPARVMVGGRFLAKEVRL